MMVSQMETWMDNAMVGNSDVSSAELKVSCEVEKSVVEMERFEAAC